mmetsp:Transcript_2192/g.2880  ORF Transcript_2192/g.2880 Transcript_2192/m.2880 type:complete len:919 (+) Transcript_2192:74-2830(+)
MIHPEISNDDHSSDFLVSNSFSARYGKKRMYWIINQACRWMRMRNLMNLGESMICLEPSMGRASKKICAVTSVTYLIYLGFILNLEDPLRSQQSNHYLSLESISTTVFGTFVFIFGLSMLFAPSANDGQTALAVFGITTNFLSGISHALHYLELAPYSANAFGHQISLVQFGEWIVCVPLLVCILGHVLHIEPKFVLLGAALEFVSLLLGFVGSITQAQGIAYGTLCMALALQLPFFTFVYILCFKLASKISKFQQRKIRALGLSILVIWTTFPLIYFLATANKITHTLEAALLAEVDVLSKSVFFAVVLFFHIHSTDSEKSSQLEHLKKAQSSQKEFLRFVFHEVRNPFNSLFLGLEHLVSQQEFEEYAPLLKMILSAAEAMNCTINGVLSLSNLEDGLTPKKFNTRTMANDALKNLEELIHGKNIHTEVIVDPNLPRILIGDMKILTQIIEQLVKNAIEASGEGSKVVIHIEVKEKSHAFCSFAIKVEDNGVGISKKDQEKLFTPQLQSHSNLEGRRSGLGLSIVKRIVELHNGSVDVRSELGEGSEFTVTINLPVHAEGSKSEYDGVAETKMEGRCSASKGSRDSLSKESPGSMSLQASKRHFSYSEDFNLGQKFQDQKQNELKDVLGKLSQPQQRQLGTMAAAEATPSPVPTPLHTILQSRSRSQSLTINMEEGKHSLLDKTREEKPSSTGPVSCLPIEERRSMSPEPKCRRTQRADLKEEPSSQQKLPSIEKMVSINSNGESYSRRSSITKDSTRNSNYHKEPQLSSKDENPDISDKVAPQARSTEKEKPAKHILVVDDSLMNRKLVQNILLSEGYKVDLACDGDEAVDMMKANNIYGAIVMDNFMPNMSGVEATKQISSFSQVPIIGLTGNSLNEDIQEFLEAGAKEVLLKPCTKQKVLERIEKYYLTPQLG